MFGINPCPALLVTKAVLNSNPNRTYTSKKQALSGEEEWVAQPLLDFNLALSLLKHFNVGVCAYLLGTNA